MRLFDSQLLLLRSLLVCFLLLFEIKPQSLYLFVCSDNRR